MLSSLRSFIALGAALLAAATADVPSSEYLFYEQAAQGDPVSLPWAPQVSLPAKNSGVWESKTLPVGNGRVGGTIFGGAELERINLNEVSLWSGGPNLPKNGHHYNYGPLSGKDDFGCYQPFGNLFVKYDLPGETTDYRRGLNLRNGVPFVTFRSGGIRFNSRCFVSEPDDVMVYTMAADRRGAINARIAITPYHSVYYSVQGKDTIRMHGTLANGQRFEGRVMIRCTGGSFSANGGDKHLEVSYKGKAGSQDQMPVFDASGVPFFHVKGATRVELYVSLATDYKMSSEDAWKGEDPARHNDKVIAAVRERSLKEIHARHSKHYKSLYDRLKINLGSTKDAVSQLPTDKRLAHYRKTRQPDPQLESTIYQYGRYLLICGSRPGNLPVNLQGIWNDRVSPAWASDYHNNINLQMCYWGAEVANLSECHLPLIHFIRAMEAPLSRMTRTHFGDNIRGWTTRISQNPWGGGGWEMWNPPVNAWYALHLWDHYQFTQDKSYLRTVAFPILKNICHYWEDSLKTIGAEGKGLLSDGAPLSADKHPELREIPAGSLVAPDGWSHEWGPVEDGCAHDQQLIRELFTLTAEAAGILKKDEKWAASLLKLRDRLVKDRIAPGGYLQEWIVDRPNKVSGHRHTSHLIAVYPGTTISTSRTPELARAAMKSLELRGLSNDNRRSWTWPWRTALWARFQKPEQAYQMVQSYIQWNLLDNLFGNHPPMQMDGSFGMTGGMSEMLVQSHAGEIHLLPALPKAWRNGHVRGIRARGNITIDMKWKNGQVTGLRLTTSSPSPEPVTVRVNGKCRTVTPTVAQ